MLMRVATIRSIGAALLLVLLQQSTSGQKLQYITVKCRSSSEIDLVYEMKDNGDGRIWDQFLRSGQTASISLQSNMDVDDGYGDLLYRVKGDAQWNQSGHLRNGETITLARTEKRK